MCYYGTVKPIFAFILFWYNIQPVSLQKMLWKKKKNFLQGHRLNDVPDFVCQVNQGQNESFSEDPDANNRQNIPLLAKLTTKRLTTDDLQLVTQSKTKNKTTDTSHTVSSSSVLSSPATSSKNSATTSFTSPTGAEVSTQGTKRKVAQMNPESSPSLSSEVHVNPSPLSSPVSA
jgi:hypothetical protein